MRYTYLLINILTVLFPVMLSFDKRVQFGRRWKLIWPGMIFTGLVFLSWDILFTLKGVWHFNSSYILGFSVYGLPFEEILFFITVPFACIFIYACLNYYVRWQMPGVLSNSLSLLLMLAAALLAFIGHKQLYTLVTFGLLFILLLLLQFILRCKWLPRFYIAYMVSLIPFFIVNGILTAIPVVIYNDTENLSVRIGTIPVEDLFYSMALLLMNIAFFEYFSTRAAKRHFNG